jgi:hypothetical protein
LRNFENILFLIPDSTGIRNYLYSNILSNLENKINFFFWSVLPEDAFVEVKFHMGINYNFKQIKVKNENLLTRFYREVASYARLVSNSSKAQNPTIMSNWNNNPIGFKQLLFNRLIRLVGRVIAKHYKLILKLEAKSRGAWNRDIIDHYKSELKDSQIDKIFITHQRVAFLMPICIAAKELGIEVITVIYSWDNLPKARLNVMADKYLVWSDYMKGEMEFYYPEINTNQVVVTGTPQFEFYQNESNIIEKETFAKSYDLDVKKKWILYSGGDQLTSPYDQEYVADLMAAIRDRDDIQIILRRSPADFTSRFNTVIGQYKNKLKVIDPNWSVGNEWSSNVTKVADFRLLASLAFHCAAAINVGSTVAHDFANFNKPTIYINYDANTKGSWRVAMINGFQHFRSMPSKDCVVWVNQKLHWNKVINDVIMRADEVASDRLNWYRKINKQSNVSPSYLIAEVLLKQ